MFNKILVFGGTALAAILLVENLVISTGVTFIFVWHGKAGELVMWSLVIGGLIGFGIKGLMSDKNYKEEDLNF